MRTLAATLIAAVLACASLSPAAAQTGGAAGAAGAGSAGDNVARARAIFKELIEINTTDSVGNNTQAAEAMAARL